MRTSMIAGLFALALALGGCTDIAACKQDTLFLTVTLDAAAADSDHLIIDVSIDSGSVSETVLPHTRGVAQGAVEIDFSSGYPSGHTAHVVVTATASGATVGSGSTSGPLAAGCTTLSVAVHGGAAGDMTIAADMTTPGDLAQSDLAQPDFAQPDLAPPPADLASADVAQVLYAVGGSVTGLSSAGLVLASSINGGAAEQLPVSTNGAFVFPTKAPPGASYAVSVFTQPSAPAQTCIVTAGAGNANADVTTVQVRCPPFVLASGLDSPNTVAVNGANVYFGVGIHPSVADCYTTNPTAGDALMMVATTGGSPARIDYLENVGGNCGLYGVVFDSTYVYWTNYPTGNIKRATLAGASPSPVATVQGYNNALAIGGGNLYWHSYPNASIGRVSTAGTGNTTFTSTASTNGQNLATDGSTLYFTDYSAGTVNKVPFSATPLPASPTSIVTGEANPSAPFVTATTIYWIQPGAAGALRYASLSSPSAASLNTSPLAAPGTVVVDASYAWVLAQGTSFADGRIYRIPVGGGAPVIVADGLNQPNSIAMDAGHLYWANNSTTQGGGTRNSDGTITMIVK
jgi:hypothetical protein